MTENQENLRIVYTNKKFWEYMVDEKDEIMREELQKVDDAKTKFQEMFRRLQSAPKKLVEAQRNEKILQAQIKKERELPVNDRAEVLSLIDQMKAKLRTLGIAC